MCTVSYIPYKNGVILTSNRDEHINRGIALYPKFYQFADKKLAFPKDSKAGGTWFITNEYGDAAILLNGAFEKHTPIPPYRKSRGHILPEIFHFDSPFDALKKYNLNGIENFTIILWEQGTLRECKWDGENLKIRLHNTDQAHIWSSVTLYDEDMIFKRHCWFYDWLKTRNRIMQEDIINFHSNTHLNNREYGLRISRANLIATSSITSFCLENTKAVFYHYDIMQNIESTLDYNLIQVQQIIKPINADSGITQKI
ncbi:NRDE family protein [Sediminibacterium sp.]|uniref:NRDE family protein n=1 Tax=Sediminibacterium sp. TaxID=1917865 RepID=UPI0025F7D6F0|nr:NRDE family protein [Sediminibacterium sp.]MBT9484485.1 NRDE family protein [Sediminibacterium sp.]